MTCAESSGELKEGTRNRWFCLFTNTQIDLGFVIGTLVPYVNVIRLVSKPSNTRKWRGHLLTILTHSMVITRIAPNNLTLVWRLSLALGVVPPLSLLYLRIKLKEPESYSRESFRKTKTPYWLALKFYGPRLAVDRKSHRQLKKRCSTANFTSLLDYFLSVAFGSSMTS